MTYARLFEHFDLLGGWIDSAEQFSPVLWDRRAAVALGCTVTASELPDPVGQVPERILAEVLARTRSASSESADRAGVIWDRESGIRRLPWKVLPVPGVARSAWQDAISGDVQRDTPVPAQLLAFPFPFVPFATTLTPVRHAGRREADQ